MYTDFLNQHCGRLGQRLKELQAFLKLINYIKILISI